MDQEPRNTKYFFKYAKRIVFGTGITGLIAGGVPLFLGSQYFREIPEALAKGEISTIGAITALCYYVVLVLPY